MSDVWFNSVDARWAFDVFRGMDWPDLGEIDAWEWWVTRAWQGLDDIGWFDDLAERGTFAFEQQQLLAVFALRWLAEDLCEQVADGNVPDWSEWASHAQIDLRLAMNAATNHPRWAAFVALTREACDEEVHLDMLDELDELDTEEERAEEAQRFEQEVDAILDIHAVCFVAAQMRPVLVRALDRVWGGRHRLFQSWWATLHSHRILDPYDDKDDMEDAERLDDEEAGEGVEYNADACTRSLAHRLNEAAADAFDDCFAIDAETGTRLIVCEWVMGGCGVCVQGEPAYWGSS